MRKLTLLILSVFLSVMTFGQTVLISPTGDGGFETGATLSANGWTAVNNATNAWNVGTATFSAGTKSAYISNTAGSTYAYANGTSAVSHFYRDVTVPAGETAITLSFKLKGDGDIFSGIYYDKLMVYTAPTTFVPTTTSPASSGTTLTGATLVYAQAANYGAAYTTVTVTLPASLAGTSFRLLFTWHNDGSAGTVPSSVDEISLISKVPIAADAAPITFDPTLVTQTGMTIGWTDNSTNETAFRVYRSTDNITFIQQGTDIASTTTAGTGTAYTQTQTSLTPGTIYYYRIVAVLDLESPYLIGNQATNAAGVVTSTVTGGLWSATTTWAGGVLPTATDNVIIADGATVTVDITTATCWNLTVGQGTSGILNYLAGTASTLTVNNSVTIAVGGVFNAGSGTLMTHLLNIGGSTNNAAGNGSIINNGIFDMYGTAGITVTFFGLPNATISGTGATLDFYRVILNKGAVTATSTVIPPVLEMMIPFTVQGVNTTGLIYTHTAGTFKISGSFTQSNPIFTTTAYIIPAIGGIWLNNPNFTISPLGASPTINGLFRVTSGTYNIGTAAGNSVSSGIGAVVIIEGGAINVAGRFNLTSTGVYYNQSSGTLSVVTVGNTSVANAGFGITSGTSSFIMSGGTIALVQRNGGALGATTRDYYVLAAPTITGGTLQVGTAATAANFNFRLYGYAPNVVIDNTTNPKKVEVYQTTGTLIILGTLTVNTGTTFDCLGMTAQVLGNVVNNGIIQGLIANSRFDFVGTTPQAYTGTGTFGTLALPFIGLGVGISNANNVTLNSPVYTTRVNLFTGSFINSTQFNLGIGGTSSVYIQRGGSAANPAGSFDVLPTFNIGTGGLTLNYTTASTATTSGFEIPASRVAGNLIINNAPGVTLAGGPLSTGAMTMTLGNITTTSANLLTITGAATTAITYTAGFVNGPMERTLPASLVTGSTYIFPVGKGSYNPFALVNPTTNAGGAVVVKAEVFDASCGGTPGTLMGALNSNRYWAASITFGSANFINSLIQLNDAPAGADAIAASATLTGAYDLVGGTAITSTASSLTTTAPEATTLAGFFVMGNKAAATLSNLAITPTGNQCTNVARTVTVTATPGGAAVTGVVINYSINGVAQTAIVMTNTSGNDWSGTIPTVTPANANVTWSVTATDANLLTKTAIGTPYTDEPALGITATASASLTTVCSGSPTTLNVALSSSNPASYTTPAVTNPTTDEDLGNITISEGATTILNNSSTRNTLDGTIGVPTGTAGSYSNYTSFGPYNLTAGGTYDFSASTLQSATAYGNAIGIYIDYNRNGVFTDAGEAVYVSAATTLGAHTETGSFIIPTSAFNGLTRMRIVVNEGLVTGPNMAVSWGEFEDYLLNISSTNNGGGAPVTASAYSWSDGSIVVGTTNPLTVNPITNKTYTATATISGCPVVSNGVAVTVNPLPSIPTANNSSQCGAAVPTCSVTSTSGAGSPTFNWYNAPTGGSLITGNTATYGGPAISVPTHFYVSEFDGTCESPRVDVFANVGAAPALTITADQSVCNNSVATLTVTSTLADFDSYAWSPVTDLFTDLACTTPYVALANASTVYVKSSTGATVTYTCNSLNTTTFCTNIATTNVTTLPSVGQTISINGNDFCMSGSSVLTATPTTGFGTATFQWQNSSDNITFNDIIGENSTTYTTPSITSTNYYKLLVKIGASVCLESDIATVIVNNPLVASTAPDTRCGTGTVTLGATGSVGTTLNWFAAATGGSSLGIGSSFTTPSISSTTNYYVEASQISGTTNEIVGSTVLPSSPSSSTSPDAGIVFTTTVANLPIVSARILVLGTGNITFQLQDGTGTMIASYIAPIAGATTAAFTTVNFPASFITGAAGGYRLLATAKDAGITWYYPSGTYPYNSTSGALSITSGWGWGATTTTDIRCIHNISVTVENVCRSTRSLVIATVSTPPSVTAGSTPASICVGETITLDASSTNTGYTYTWSPSTTPATGSSVSATPGATTLYSVTATDNTGGAFDGCVTNATVNVIVNPLPSAVTVTPASQAVCAGSIQQLVVSGGTLSGVPVLTENFDSGVGSFSIVASSSTATQDWAARANGYVYSTYTFSGSTNGFMLANSDIGGSGATTNTQLVSPSFSTLGFSGISLNFKEYLNNATDIAAAVEISDDDFATSTSLRNNITTDIGTITAFAATSLPIPVAFENKANVKIRFRYEGSWDWFWAVDEISISGTQSTNITWTPTTDLYTDAAATIAYTGGNATTTYTKPISDVTYTVTATSGFGCTSSGTSVITVNSLPTASLTSSPTVTICNGGSTSIILTLTGAQPWVLTATDGTSTGPLNAATSPHTINVNPTVNTTYSIISIADANGCTNTSTASVFVTVNTPATVTITENAGVLTSSAATGNQWYDASGLIPGETSQTFTPSANGNYYVIVTDGNSCTATSNTISFVLSMDSNLFNAGISVYPNPAYDKVFVEISNPSNSKFTIEILSMDGRILYENKSITKANSTLSIDLSDFASGVYFVKAISESNTVIQKIVVE